MNTASSFETSAPRAQNNDSYLLKMALDAMLDTLTVEQQAKMASYLLRSARKNTQSGEQRAVRTLVLQSN